MPRKIAPAVALSAAALLLSGCGSDDSADAQPQATATATQVAAEAKSLPEADLKKALLTVDEMPTGYAQDPAQPNDEEIPDRTSDDPKCQALLDDYAAFQEKTMDAASADASFSNEGTGSFAGVELESYEGDEATEGIALMAETYETCGTWTESDSSGEGEISASRLSFPALGDDTYASRLSFEIDGVDLSANVVVTRVGKSVSFVYHLGVEGTDTAETEQIARASVEKLEKASVT